MISLSIDPSINTLGVCLHNSESEEWNWAQINVIQYENLPERMGNIANQIRVFLKRNGVLTLDAIGTLVCEFPQFFNNQRGNIAAVKGYTNDLAAICGYMAAICKFAKTTFYTPSQWKGQLTKQAIEFRFKKTFETNSLPSDHEQEASMMLWYHQQKMNDNSCKVEPSSRVIIENKILMAMDDKDKVVLILSEKDLNILIDGLNMTYNTSTIEMCKDLTQLKDLTFKK